MSKVKWNVENNFASFYNSNKWICNPWWNSYKNQISKPLDSHHGIQFRAPWNPQEYHKINVYKGFKGAPHLWPHYAKGRLPLRRPNKKFQSGYPKWLNLFFPGNHEIIVSRKSWNYSFQEIMKLLFPGKAFVWNWLASEKLNYPNYIIILFLSRCKFGLHIYIMRPVFIQRLFFWGIFVQSISSNPIRLG